MSTTNGPFALTLGEEISIPNPVISGQDFVNVQLQNSSVFVITVLASGLTYTIQPFVAQTIPLTAQGTPILVTPSQNPSGTKSGASSTLTAVWLLAHEAPPMQDGPLTAAAILAGLGSQGLAGEPGIGGVTAALINVNPGTDGLIGAPGAAQMWSWGWAPIANGTGAFPTRGQVLAIFTESVYDALTIQEGSSSRLSGLRIPGGNVSEIFNNTDVELLIFLNYSLT